MDNTATKDANRMLFSHAMRHITPQCGSFCDGGEVTVLEKSRKLGAVRQDIFNNGGIMACVGSDFEDELPRSTSSTIKRFKFPKKFFDDYSTVCHVSVPRKLRSSAMKKRCSESISPPLQVSNKLKRVADGDQLLQKDCLMKSKLKMKQAEAEGCVTDSIRETVTKDEEEVAEALYALSGVFPHDAKIDKTKLDGGVSGPQSSTFTKDESFVTSLDAVGRGEEEHKAVGSAGVTLKLHDTAQPDSSIGKQPLMKLDSDIPEVNLHLTAFISENQQATQKAICSSVSGAWTHLRKTRTKMPMLEKSQSNFTCQEIVVSPVAGACDQTGIQYTSMDTRNDGLLKPDTFSAISCDSQGLGIPFQLHTAKLPACTESTVCSGKSQILETSAIVKKDAQFSSDSKNSWKRCSAHVYISRFIKAFQNADGNNKLMMQSAELTMNEPPKLRAHITDIDLNVGRNCLIGVVSSNTVGGSSPVKNAIEVKNAILLHKRLVKDQQLASKPYEVYTAQNQSSGFSSMPAGSGRMETTHGINGVGNGLEASTSVRVPYLQSQNQASIPFPVPQNCYSSTSFSGHRLVAPEQQVELPPYFGGRSCGPALMDANALSVCLLEPQQRKRAPLLMANFEPGVASSSIPNRQTVGPDIPPFLQRVHSFPHSLPSLDVIGSRYAPVLQQQQQQQLISATSLLPASMLKGQYHHLPSVYEANVGRVRPDNVSLQIICNQYI